ncbi:hypothetical protein GCM10025860_00910 [Methanobacterium ferruginis]|nr:hypothetical protein GCM10025860_00910 [Methanobacterium ferruginis]
MLETIPDISSEALAMIARLFGDWKNAAPTPKRPNLHKTSKKLENMVNWVMEKRASPDKIEPVKARYLDPNLSEKEPLKGANTIMIIGAAVKINPVTFEPRCKTFCR